MPGQMVHLEIPAGDTAKAREFWSSLFGWQWQDFGGQRTPNGNECGLWQTDPDAPAPGQ